MAYPIISNDWPPNFNTIPGLEIPEDAKSEVTINNRTAYLVHGRWTDEVLLVFAETGKALDDTEWDNDIATLLYFALELRDGGIVGIERGRHWITLPRSREVIQEGDRLVVYGELDALRQIFKVE